MSRNTEVIVFNDEETEQLEKRHLNNSRNQGQSVLALEMSQLADKVRNL